MSVEIEISRVRPNFRTAHPGGGGRNERREFENNFSNSSKISILIDFPLLNRITPFPLQWMESRGNITAIPVLK